MIAAYLFCGLGGWTEGLMYAGYDVDGYDIEEHVYGDERYPAALHVRDVLTMHGSELAHVDLIVASPPCQEYSYMAMPWSRAKAKAAAIRADETGVERQRLNRLFNACFRIQREASEAAGRPIPMVVENVRGAQDWVGKAATHWGSFYLWGNVPEGLPKPRKVVKVLGFRFDGSGKSFQTAAVEGTKHGGDWFHDPACPSRQGGQGRKGVGSGADWFDGNHCVHSSKSPARKAASARIAKIPFRLAYWVGRLIAEQALDIPSNPSQNKLNPT